MPAAKSDALFARKGEMDSGQPLPDTDTITDPAEKAGLRSAQREHVGEQALFLALSCPRKWLARALFACRCAFRRSLPGLRRDCA